MTSDSSARSRHYRFKLEVEVTDALDLSGGDLSELISLGLIELDHRGHLFPGLMNPQPGSHLLEVGLEYIGATRRAHSQPTAAPEPSSRKGQRRSSKAATLADDLEAKALELGDTLIRLRMLQARMNTLAQMLDSGKSSPDEQATGKSALEAAESVMEHAGKLLPAALG